MDIQFKCPKTGTECSHVNTSGGTLDGECSECEGTGSSVGTWVKFDFTDKRKRPKEYGRYLVCRKDGKIHWEIWNGTGWAYNHNEVRYFSKTTPPINVS